MLAHVPLPPPPPMLLNPSAVATTPSASAVRAGSPRSSSSGGIVHLRRQQPLRADHRLGQHRTAAAAEAAAAAAAAAEVAAAAAAAESHYQQQLRHPRKRRPSSPTAEDAEDADSGGDQCVDPNPCKAARTVRGPCIATNPRYRRRSQGAATAAAVASASALVQTQPLPVQPPPPPPPQAHATTSCDAQTSPTRPTSPASPTTATTPKSVLPAPRTPLAGWARTARRKIAARLRSSLSASRLGGGGEGDIGVADDRDRTPKQPTRKRHSSLQRLVQRISATPPAKKPRTPVSASSPAVAAAAAAAAAARCCSPCGRVLRLGTDGSRVVRLQRPKDGKFGFFVTRRHPGEFVYLSRFNNIVDQLRYQSVLGVGDQILEIEGMATESMDLVDICHSIADCRTLVMRVRSEFAW